MVKKTTTAKKIPVTSSKSPKKTAAAKATPKAAKTTKAVKKKTAAKKTSASVKKTPVKKTVSAAKTAAKKTSKPAPVPSPVRKVEEVEASSNQFTGTWMLILIGVLVFVAGLGWWISRDTSGVSVEAESVEIDTYSDGFQPTVNVIEN